MEKHEKEYVSSETMYFSFETGLEDDPVREYPKRDRKGFKNVCLLDSCTQLFVAVKEAEGERRGYWHVRIKYPDFRGTRFAFYWPFVSAEERLTVAAIKRVVTLVNDENGITKKKEKRRRHPYEPTITQHVASWGNTLYAFLYYLGDVEGEKNIPHQVNVMEYRFQMFENEKRPSRAFSSGTESSNEKG